MLYNAINAKKNVYWRTVSRELLFKLPWHCQTSSPSILGRLSNLSEDQLAPIHHGLLDE